MKCGNVTEPPIIIIIIIDSIRYNHQKQPVRVVQINGGYNAEVDKYWPRFSAEAFISLIVRGHREVRPPIDDPCAPCPDPPLLLLLFPLPTAFPGECSDWLLWRLMVGSRATKDALCLKLEDARLMRDLRFDPNLSGGFQIRIWVLFWLCWGSVFVFICKFEEFNGFESYGLVCRCFLYGMLWYVMVWVVRRWLWRIGLMKSWGLGLFSIERILKWNW